jgi:hypothetical protein
MNPLVKIVKNNGSLNAFFKVESETCKADGFKESPLVRIEFWSVTWQCSVCVGFSIMSCILMSPRSYFEIAIHSSEIKGISPEKAGEPSVCCAIFFNLFIFFYYKAKCRHAEGTGY